MLLRVQYKSLRGIASEAMWIIGGQIALLTGGIASVSVLTDLISPAEYGKVALSLTLSQLINQTITGGISQGVARYYPVAAEDGDLGQYLSSVLRMTTMATLSRLRTTRDMPRA